MNNIINSGSQSGCKLLLIITITIVSSLWQSVTMAQAEQFPIGTFHRMERHDPAGYNSLNSSGMNTVVQYGDEITLDFLENYNVIAENADGAFDVINHYATGYYTKWEAEKDQETTERTGIVHEAGQTSQWQGTQCWSSIGATAPACSLIYGPHYRQDKNYRQYLYNTGRISYTARFRMALHYNPQMNPADIVCEIRVQYRYAKIYPDGSWTVHDAVFINDMLTVSDFNQDGSFKDFDLQYTYPDIFPVYPLEGKMLMALSDDIRYSDINGENGIGFHVDWLGTEPLYIDYIEVFDNAVWNDFIQNPNDVAIDIKNYASNYLEYPNLKYWYGHDEPYTLDAFTPMHIVDSLIRSVGAPSLITEFYPRGLINGDTLLVKFYEMAKPEKLMIDFYPIGTDVNIVQQELERLRQQLAIAHSLQPGFWYVAQAFGHQLPDDSWCVWRKPEPSEFKAMLNLALAHGTKGLLTWAYPTRYYSYGSSCESSFWERGIVDENLNPTDLWYVIHDNFIPRLEGTFGQTLTNLDYTGNYIHAVNNTGQNDYLAIQNYDANYDWFAGFLHNKTDAANEYFLLTNLRTDDSRIAKLVITNNSGYANFRVTNIETLQPDTVLNTSLTLYQSVPAGEGYLYQAVPVVKYGGKLKYNETISGTNTLLEQMTIENGVTLTINGTYNIYKNITVKTGGRIVANLGAVLKFYNGSSLIVNGTLTANGNSANRITFTGSSMGAWNGIKFISAGGTISYCDIINANTALFIENSSPSILYCHIDASQTGVYVKGSTSWPTISYSYIEGDGYCVAHYFNGNGNFFNNSFRNSLYGAYVSSGSPHYDYYGAGRNIFENSISRDKVYSNGLPAMGSNNYFTIPGTGKKYIKKVGTGTIYANNDYWSAYPPSDTYFYGSVIRSNPLQNPPSNPPAGPGWTLSKGAAEDFFSEYNEATMLFYDGKYEAAKERFKALTEKYIDSEYSCHSLNHYILSAELAGGIGKEVEYLKSIRQYKSAHKNTQFYALKWLLQLEMRNGTTEKAKNLASEVETASVYDWELSLDLAVGLFEFKGDKLEAEEILDRLSTKFTDNDTEEAITFIRNQMSNGSNEGKEFSKRAEETGVPDKYELLGNYPNPFNPTTTIKYALPNQSSVELIIYDIMGREVKTFNISSQPSGYQNIVWDGKNENGSSVASGVYIYKLQIKSLENLPDGKAGNEIFVKAAKL